MKAVKCLVILMALAYCVEGRERLGKIFKRQARHREDKAIQGPQAGSIHQTVVRNTFAQPQSQVSDGKTQGSEISVPLIPQEFRQAPYQQAQQQVVQPAYAAQQIAPNPYQPNIQHASPPSYAAQPIAPTQYQPNTQQVVQSSYPAQPIPQTQYQPNTQQVAQSSYPAQPIPQTQYQPNNQQVAQTSYPAQPIPQTQYQPITSNQVQQGQDASYSEISLAQALKSSQYSQALVQAFRTSPAYAQPIAVLDVTNKIRMRLPSNATIIRPNIVGGFSCAGRAYGYYADIANDCQIFHICFPLRSVFKPEVVPDVTYEYSFICNEFTRFSQDSLTCAWRYEAVPCKESELLYSINDHFFKITTPAPKLNYRPIDGPIGGSVQVGGVYPVALP